MKRNIMLHWFCLIGVTPWLVLSLGSCSDDDSKPKPPPPSPPVEIGKAEVWLTMGDQSKLLSHENDISITAISSGTMPLITVDENTQFQTIEGFGAALTGSSAYLINQKLSAAQKQVLLNDLFNPETGIGINYLRLTIGASDFSLSDYTYNDRPAGETDHALEHFSIAKDKQDLIPVLKSVITTSPDIKLMGSPWSPPAWMKTNQSLKGGKLKTDAYDAYASYFEKYITAMAAEGIRIDAITVQNEPLHYTAGYPCMEMTATEQKNFIKHHLGPLFKTKSISTKIILYDHNWDNVNYAIGILDDPEAKQYVAGSAFHAYGGNVTAMSVVNSAHPDKGLYFTEVSGGGWATDFSDNLQWNMANIFIGTTKNWSKTALLWNLALDQNNGPTNNGCQDCRGVVTINSVTGAVTRNVEYYSIGHFSKFIRTGASRISSSISTPVASVDHVTFVNPDGSKVMVISNNGDDSQDLAVKDVDVQFIYTIPAKSVATIIWE